MLWSLVASSKCCVVILYLNLVTPCKREHFGRQWQSELINNTNTNKMCLVPREHEPDQPVSKTVEIVSNMMVTVRYDKIS